MRQKKGVTKYKLDDDEAKEYLNYVPRRPELIQWDELKLSPNFAVKDYKDSIYRGVIMDAKR